LFEERGWSRVVGFHTRKALAELAVSEPKAFEAVVKAAK
jgi:ribosomal protein L20